MLKVKGLIAVCSLFVLTSALGGVSGWFLGKMFADSKVIENATYVDGVVEFSKNNEAVKKLYGAAKIDDISKIDSIDISTLVDFNGLTIGDILEVAQLNTYNNQYVKVLSNNLAKSNAMGIKNEQVTNSTRIKKDKLYFKENVSYSTTASFGERSYNINAKVITPLSQPLDNKIQYFRLSKIKAANNVDFNQAKQTDYYVNVPEGSEVTPDGKKVKSYSTFFGTSMYKPFNYEFNENNILKGDGKNYSAIEVDNSKTGETVKYETKMNKTDSGYEFTFAIDLKAMENYASYIKTTTRDASPIAAMDEKPTFKKAGVKVVTDKKLLIQSMHADELYDVDSGLVGAVPTLCSSDLTFIYGDKDVKIPTIMEKINYEA